MNSMETKPAAIVVNDDPTQLAILAGLLVKAGIEAHAFAEAEAALITMDPARPPDLIVTDLYMPGIDGWRFCRLLRSPEYAAYNEIPILVVSATFAGDHPARIAADIGADAFLPSPVDGRAFVSQVQGLLMGKEARLLPRVLIVEDSKTLAGLLKKTFAAHGYMADVALSTREAEAAFAKTPYNVTVLDYHLPDGTGDALLDAFRMQRPECVCLMMTAESSPELALSWMKRGAAAYLRKPFEPELLIELCARARRERALLRIEDLLEVRTRELRESEERYRLFFEGINDAAFVHELDEQGQPGCFLDCNEAACRRLGYQRDELLSLTPRDITDPAEYERLAGSRGELTNQGNVLIETVHVAKNGRRIPVEGNVRRITYLGRPAALSVSRDITERKRAEEALKESEAKNRALLAAIPDNMFVFSKEGFFIACNAVDPDLLLLPPQAFLNKHVSEVLSPEMATMTLDKLEKLFQSRQPQMYEYQVEIRGQPTYFEARIVIASEDSALAIVRDITARRRAELAERDERADRELIGCIATEAINTNHLIGFQQVVLPLLGKALDVSRTYVFTYRHDSQMMDNTAEWVAPGVTPQQSNLQGMSADPTRWWIATLMRGEAIQFADIEDIPDESTINDLRSQDIRAVLVIPLFIGTRYCGFIGLDECRCRREWTPRERNLLAEVAGILMGVWAEDAAKLNESYLSTILENQPGLVWLKDTRNCFLAVNSAFAVSCGLDDPSQLRGKSDLDIWPAHLAEKYRTDDAVVMAEGKPKILEELIFDQGVIKWFETFKSPVFNDQGDVIGTTGFAQDITERKLAEEALRESERRLADVIEFLPDATLAIDRDKRIIVWNKAIEEMTGISSAEMIGQGDYAYALPFYGERRPQLMDLVFEDSAETATRYPAITRQGDTLTAEVFCNALYSGRGAWVFLKVSPLYDVFGHVIGAIESIRDITERKRAEEEREILQVQLIQAQKMESVGRLAGGVAHDFNNMLGAILGYTGLALDQTDPSDPLSKYLQQILKAAERSADLTRQLLAFARKQTVAPKVLALNETVEGMLRLLRRLIGEDIDLAWLPGRELWPVKMDHSQLDQILANLCVNARDAIAGVGKVTIETANTVFDAEFCARHAGFVPGDYVLLAVSDNGCGMDAETLSRIFEPFFTTKEVGQGTGLGLASVYGAVTQNNGFINTYSEPGQGTTFKIYLPRHTDIVVQATAEPQQAAARGSETVLLVEDEPMMLELTMSMLEQLGYTVLAARTPGEAMLLAREHSGSIDLLITDVVMPEMNGRDLAGNLLALYPGMKCLFMSGYTANVIAHHGVLDEGVHFLEKPFLMTDLAANIRKALGQ